MSRTFVLVMLTLSTTTVNDVHAASPASNEQSSQPIRSRFDHDFDRNHDQGAMFRLAAGVGFGNNSYDDGVEFTLSLASGWLPINALALHGGFWGATNGTYGAFGLGPGVTYWFDPQANTFISASAGLVTPMSPGAGWFDQLAIGGEMELGIGSWTGASSSLGGSLYLGGEGFNVDGDEQDPSGWRTGVRVTFSWN